MSETPFFSTEARGVTDHMTSRYGRRGMSRGARRRVAIGLRVLVVVATLALAAVAYQRFEGEAVKSETAAYETLDDQTMSVTISVTRRDPSTPVVCIVRVMSRDGAETGRREIVVPETNDKTVQVTTTVKSYARPVLGDVYGCGTTVPGYLVAS